MSPCRRCGACCRGTGNVFLTPGDCEALAAYCGISVHAFRIRFCRTAGGQTILCGPLHAHNPGACIFLKENSCSVYPARPAQCVRWPRWERLYRDPEVYRDAQRYCGMLVETGHSDFRKWCEEGGPSGSYIGSSIRGRQGSEGER